MTTYAFTEAGITAALTALGNTAPKVADMLLAGGHIGNPDDDCGCPVALYLTSLYPDDCCSVHEEPPNGLIAEVYRDSDGQFVQVPLPAPVSEFVRRFDSGEFAELDRHCWAVAR